MAEEAERQTPGIRIGEAERRRAIDQLRSHTGAGLIDLDEFAERVERVLVARTDLDLAPVLADLPAVEPTMAQADAVVAQAGTKRTHIWAVMSGASRKGLWRVPEEVTVTAFWGGVHLDLRNAVLEAPMVRIRARAIMGGISIIVPEGVPVEVTGGLLMGGVDDLRRGRQEASAVGAPLIEVRASGIWGGVSVKTKRKRRADSEVIDAAAVGPVAEPRTAEPVTDTIAPAARPAVAPSVPTTSMLSIMVTDIVGSTRMAERLGDQRWLQVLQAHNELVRRQVELHGGTEVKQNGDGFLLTFPSTRSAVLSGLAIRDEIGRFAAANPDSSLRLRIGVHAGEVARDGHDVFGVNVSTADRLSSAAEPGEVLVSALVVDLAGSSSDIRFGPGREIAVDGRSHPIRVHRADAAP